LPPAPPHAEDRQGEIVGEIKSGDSTDATLPEFSGTGTPGSTIIIEDEGKEIAQIPVDPNGNWTWTPLVPLGEGDHSITVKEQQPNGKISPPSAALDFTIDITPPTAIASISAISDDTGLDIADFITNDQHLVIHGSMSEALAVGEKVQIRIDAGKWQDVDYDAAHQTWQFDNRDTSLADGDYLIETRTIDAAGNSTPGKDQVITIDTAAPDKPAMPEVWDNVGEVIGAVANASTIDDNRPLLSGKVDEREAGGIVTIYLDGKPIGAPVMIEDDGHWQFQPSTDWGEGRHIITTRITDRAGNISAPSDDFELVIDTSAAFVNIAGFDDDFGALQGPVTIKGADGVLRTDDSTPKIYGTASPAARILVRCFDEQGNETFLGEVIAAVDGRWQLEVIENLKDGHYQFEVVATNAAGNKAVATDLLVIDTAPPALTLSKGADEDETGILSYENITNNNTPTLNGTTEAHSHIRIYDGTGKIVIAETQADSAGKWQITINPPLADGQHILLITATDDVGNESDPVIHSLTVDTIAPTANAELTAISEDSGISNSDFVTNDDTLIYSFTPDAPLARDETIWMRINKALTGETVVDWRQATLKDGVWQIDDSAISRADGFYEIEVVVRDAAGNEGVPTRTVVEIDRHVQDNTISILNYSDHVGKEQGEFGSKTVTDDRSPTLNGLIASPLAADERIEVIMMVDGVPHIIGTATISADGLHWSIDLPELGSGASHHFIAQIVDIAGNEGAVSNDFIIDVHLSITIDQQTTHDTTPILTGSIGFDLAKGEFVEVRVNGKSYSSKTGDVVIDERNATWHLQIPDHDALPVGIYEVEAKLIKADGTIVITDNSHKELAITATPDIKVEAGGADLEQKATAITMDEHGNWLIFTNNTIMRANATDNDSLGNFETFKLQSQTGGLNGGKNQVQNGTWMDFDRDGYMDFFGTDNSRDNGQQAFLNQGDGSFRAYQVGLTNTHPHNPGARTKGGSGNGANDYQTDYNPEANTNVSHGGIIALDKNGKGLSGLVYGDQTPGHASNSTASAIVINSNGTTAGLKKDKNFQTGNAKKTSTNWWQMMPDMELSGVDLNNDGKVDLVFHATAGSNHIGKGGVGSAPKSTIGTMHSVTYSSSNQHRLVVASNEGNGDWNVTQIVENVFQRYNDTPNQTNGVAMTWADFDGDGYMDLFMGRGFGSNRAEQNKSRILFNDGKGNLAMDDANRDGVGTAKGVYKFNDKLAGGASLAIDWNHDGKMDIIELPTLDDAAGGVVKTERVGPINLYTNVSANGVIAFNTSNLLGGNRTIGNTLPRHEKNADWVTGAVTADVDWDGASDLLVFTRQGKTHYIHNDNKVAYGTALHFKILDGEGINSFFGNTVQLYDSKGKLVGTQIINPQSGNQTNDSTALVDFYGLNANETYTLVMFHHHEGRAAHIGGVASIGGKTIQNVNRAWTGIKAAEANSAIILTAEAEGNVAYADKGNGIVGTGYNDTFIATRGKDAYFGGGGTVTISGEKIWSATGGLDIVDYKLAGNTSLTIDLSVSGWQNTGFNKAKFTDIEGIAGSSGNDVFTDNAGDNLFNGRGGNDIFNLIHGGKDTLLYELIDPRDATGGNGADEVNGFTIGAYEATPGADRIILSELLIGYKSAPNGPARIINGQPVIEAGDNITDYLQVKHENGNTELWIDRDGRGGAFDAVRLGTLNNVTVELAELLANHQIIV